MSQIVKNVVKTRLEMRKKSGKGVLRKVVSNILKKRKRLVKSKCAKINDKIGGKRVVIDLNVNVKYAN